jgi:signal transduction histidine kinase
VSSPAGGIASAVARRRAVENVIRNAVKFTAPGTAVEVNAGPDDPDGTFLVIRVPVGAPGRA